MKAKEECGCLTGIPLVLQNHVLRLFLYVALCVLGLGSVMVPKDGEVFNYGLQSLSKL